MRIVLVVTSAGRLDLGAMTGLWFSELSRVYDQCLRAGIEPHVVSISGGRVPLDPRSRRGMRGEVLARYEDSAFQRLLETTDPLRSIDVGDFDGLYLAGGHGAMVDFPYDTHLAQLVSTALECDVTVAAVCHGPAGLLGATAADGSPVVAGRQVTAFNWAEEGIAGVRNEVPYNLEEELVALGAQFQRAWLPLLPRVVVDGPLITGSNPASAAGVGRALIKRVLAEA